MREETRGHYKADVPEDRWSWGDSRFHPVRMDHEAFLRCIKGEGAGISTFRLQGEN
nr:hypothetical protein [Desulfatiglans anilini]